MKTLWTGREGRIVEDSDGIYYLPDGRNDGRWLLLDGADMGRSELDREGGDLAALIAAGRVQVQCHPDSAVQVTLTE